MVVGYAFEGQCSFSRMKTVRVVSVTYPDMTIAGSKAMVGCVVM